MADRLLWPSMTLQQFQEHYPALYSQLRQRFMSDADATELRRRRIKHAARQRARRERQMRRRLAALERKVFSV